jgi:hypothetical protein
MDRSYQEILNGIFEMLYVSRGYGENHAEPLFKDILKIVTQSDESRKDFLTAVKVSLFTPYTCQLGDTQRPGHFVPEELIYYVAHVTTWPEFSEIADSLIGRDVDIDKGNPLVTSSGKIRAALSASWEDRDFYDLSV